MIKVKMVEPSPLKKHWRVVPLSSLTASFAIVVLSEPIGSDVTVHLQEVRTRASAGEVSIFALVYGQCTRGGDDSWLS